MPSPAYRGAVCRGALAAIEADSRHGKRVLGSVDPSLIDSMRRANALSWIPAIGLDELNGAYLREAGPDGYLEFWRRYSSGAVHSPLFEALIHGALRISGSSPGGLLLWLGRAWGVATRDLGRVSGKDGGDHFRLVVVNLPPSGRRLSLVLSMQAAVMGMIDITENKPETECHTEALDDEGRFEISASWQPKRRA